jgi:hypothetical protein
MSSKIAYFMAQSEIFSNANRPKTSLNLIFCSIKMARHMTIMTLFVARTVFLIPLLGMTIGFGAVHTAQF